MGLDREPNFTFRSDMEMEKVPWAHDPNGLTNMLLSLNLDVRT